MIYKTLKKVSEYCQLLDKSKYKTQTDRGVTFTNNGDGSITVNGTPTGTYYSLYTISIKLDVIIPGHKYAILGTADKITLMILGNYTGGYIFKGSDNIYTLPEHEYTRFVYEIRANLGYTYSNVLVKPQLFDLTEMYGAGHEPTTVEQFRQDFPEEMYDYSPRCFVTSYKDCLKVSDYCQLLDKSKLPNTQTVNGITYTVDKVNGTITANGTATAESDYKTDIALNNAKSYTNGGGTKIPSRLLFLGCPIGGSQTTYGLYNNWVSSGVVDTGNGGITDTTSDKYYEYYRFNLRITIKQGYTANNLVFKPQIFDLTEMYGAGNEPTTVEEFRQKFPNELYDYKPYSTIPSYKKSLVCKTKNLLPYPYYDGTKTFNGITYTDNGDGTVNLSGTSTSQSNYYFSYKTLNLKKGVTYTLSASGDYSCSGSFTFYIYNSTYGQVCYIPLASSNSASFTPTQDINGINCYIVIPPDRTLNGTFKPMMELGNTATDYVPYGHL